VEAVGLQDELIKLGVEFVALAGGFVEVLVVEFGDAALLFDLGKVAVHFFAMQNPHKNDFSFV
jgi:hypothetical protein